MSQQSTVLTAPPQLAAPRVSAETRGQFLLWVTFQEMLRARMAKLGLLILLIAVTAAIFAPLLAVHDPVKTHPSDSLAQPGEKYWLGADRLGRDQVSRLIYGARVSLTVGVLGVLVAVAGGITIGTVAGWAGKWTDEVLMRAMDALASFPSLVLALALVAITGGAMRNIVIVMAAVFTPSIARVIRGQVLSVRERDYVTAAVATGASGFRIIFQHLIPNSLAPVIVQASVAFGAAIILEASLSFLGVGVKPPTPTWGGMLRHAFEVVDRAPWLTFMPGLVIFLIVLSFNFVGDALRDALDPRLRQAR
jgi:peptide/nickel transport system permease protein